MRRIINICLLCLSAFFFQSCEELLNSDKTLSADTDFFEMDFTVEASDLKGFQIFSEKLFTNVLDATIEENGMNKELLQSVILNEAKFRIVSRGAYTNLNVLKFVELTVYHDSLGEEKIARLEPIPQGQSTIDLEPGSQNLLPYFTGNSFMLTAQGYLLERVYEDIDFHARVKFKIKGGT